jgi:hypothetical protein
LGIGDWVFAMDNVGREVQEKKSSKKDLIIESENKIEVKDNINNDDEEVSSMQEDELMMKINKQAELVSDKISHKELTIFSKYDKLSEDEIKQLLKEKR